MENFIVAKKKFKFLVCFDVDGPSSAKIAEAFVPHEPQFDAVLLAGPFIQGGDNSTAEKGYALEGEMASIVAQFENIVCRVVYLPSEYDPPSALTEQLFLTPNSVNIYARRMFLADRLFITGFSELGEKLNKGKHPNSENDENDDELENVELASSTSVSIIKEILNSEDIDTARRIEANEAIAGVPGSDNPLPSNNTGIFMLNYRYSHTLNQFLFHMSEQLSEAGVNICLISSSDCDETDRLPKVFGKLAIIAPKSLRQGYYTVVEVERESDNGGWSVTSNDTFSLEDSEES